MWGEVVTKGMIKLSSAGYEIGLGAGILSLTVFQFKTVGVIAQRRLTFYCCIVFNDQSGCGRVINRRSKQYYRVCALFEKDIKTHTMPLHVFSAGLVEKSAGT